MEDAADYAKLVASGSRKSVSMGNPAALSLANMRGSRAKLRLGKPDFIEIKSVTFCGESKAACVCLQVLLSAQVVHCQTCCLGTVIDPFTIVRVPTKPWPAEGLFFVALVVAQFGAETNVSSVCTICGNLPWAQASSLTISCTPWHEEAASSVQIQLR